MNTLFLSKLFPSYAGDWDAAANATHKRLTQVTYDGSMYLSLDDVTAADVPGVSGKWWRTTRGFSAEEVAASMATQINLDEHANLAATTTQVGHVQMATDAEAAAGTNTSNAVNVKQLHANSMRRDFSNMTVPAPAASLLKKDVATDHGEMQFTQISGEYPAAVIIVKSGGLNTSIVLGSLNTNGIGLFMSIAGSYPSLGSGPLPWAQLYARTSVIAVSDAREKSTLGGTGEISEDVFRAWAKVRYCAYQMRDSIAEKGSAARIHIGVIAQAIKEAFESEGLDACNYGLLCHDVWEALPETSEAYTVEITPDVLDEQGNIITPAVTEERTRIIQHAREAGDRYAIRYEELLCLEAAYQRWLGAQRDARMDALESRLAVMEAR